MTTLSLYHQEIFTFINSFTIKIDDISTYMELNIQKTYGIRPIEKSKTKYYLNLNGELHHIDKPIVTYVTDVEEVIEINKENINSYPIFKEELLKFSTSFNNIVRENPTQALYLRGILNPIDYETVKEIEDGTILYYNKNLLEDNELSLMLEVGGFIKRFLYIYNNKGYNVDEYYIPSLIGVLYNLLPLYILSIRMKHVLSYEASNFDIYNYLVSFNFLDKKTVSFIDRKSLIWLYGELGRLKTNIGSNTVLTDVITKIYGEVGIGIGRTNLYKTFPTVDDTNHNNKLLPYTKNNFIFKNTKANKAVVYDRDSFNIKDIVDMQEILGLVKKDDKYKVITNVDNTLKVLNKDRSITKTFMFDKEEIRIFYNTTMLSLVFNNLIYQLDKGLIVSSYFINPTNGLRYRVNKSTIVYMLVKCMALLNNKDPDEVKISNFNYTHVFNPNIDIDKIIKNTVHKEKLKPFINYIIQEMNPVMYIRNTRTFTKHIIKLREVLVRIWYIISNVDDVVLTADLKYVYEQLFTHGSIVSDSTKSINDLIKEESNREIPIDRIQAFKTIVHILDHVFDLQVDEVSIIREKFKNYVNFISKFKSYTVQFIHDDDFENTLTPYSTDNVIGQKHAILGGINSACFKRYMFTEVRHFTKTTPFKDNILHIADDTEVKITTSTKSQLVIVRDMISTINQELPLYVNRNRYIQEGSADINISYLPESNITINTKESIKISSITNKLNIVTDIGISKQPSGIVVIKK